MIFQIKILGNNSAIPAHGRNQTAQLVQLDSQYILIDCGENTQSQLANLNIKLGRIKTILISHLHGDHYFGLVGLISTMHLYHRKQKLCIYAPEELKKIIELQLQASKTTLCFELEFYPLDCPDIMTVAEDAQVIVQAFPLNHGITCHGFLICEKPKNWRINKEKLPEDILIQEILTLKKGHDVKDAQGNTKYAAAEYTFSPRVSRSYAFCSDTIFDLSIVPYIKEVDMLYHEATFTSDLADRAEMTFHSTAAQAAQIAKKAKVKKLLLGHYSTRYKSPAPLLEEAMEIFPNSILSQEGETICLKE